VSAAAPTEAPAGAGPEPIKAVPVRRTGQWISAAVVIAVVALLVWSVATNENLQWSVVGDFLFDGSILRGAVTTIELTVLSMVIGVVLGVVLAVMRLSDNPVLSAVSGAYLWLFRGTPVLVQVVIWFNLALIFPTLGVGSFSVDTNSVISTFGAALLALALNEAAYMAEIVRGGILSVDRGQTEAAHALGLTGGQTMRRIVLPQAMRVIVPPTGNELVTMLKTTSLVAVIGGTEMFGVAQAIGARDFTTFPMLLVACFWYLVMTSVLSYAQARLEHRFARGTHHGTARGPGSLQRLLGRRLPTRTVPEGDAR
jgi:polar amino acid transport system permease protein